MTQTGTAPPGRDRLSKIRRYRRLMIGAVVAGTLGFIAADSLDYPLVGVGIYWAGIAAFLAIKYGTAVPLFDERDCELERRASYVTLLAFALAMIAVAPALTALAELGVYTAPPAFEGALLVIAGQAVVWGAVYLWLRYRP